MTVTPDDARALIAAGYRIIPVKNKIPAVSGWSEGWGISMETADGWFAPDSEGGPYDVGILTGHLRDTTSTYANDRGAPFFVVDIDDWVVWRDVCADHGWDHERPLGAFAKVSTPSGGVHYYFMAPAGMKITNANSFPKGIDVRGEGGYVVAPPSEGYEWR